MLWDAHCHLFDERVSDLEWQFQEAQQAGVNLWIVCSTGPDDWGVVQRLCKKYQGCVPAYGVHPWYSQDLPADWREHLLSYLAETPCLVGEVGLDFERLHAAQQEAIFQAHIALAAELHRPLNIHCRKAWHRLFPLLKPYKDKVPGFIVHAFSQNLPVAMQVVEYGGFVSFASHILRPWNQLRYEKLIRALPLSAILVETDAPDIPIYTPQTGLSGLSRLAHLPLVAQKICEWKGVSLQEFTVHLEESRKKLIGSV